ncbi:MAG: hypothetical protein M1819_000783 [Sarea resinae]|nr:MAG: hypothetical protein M1819_000783 [Sarea resinae]
MPVMPFPSSLSIGTDICHIARIQRLITRDAQGKSLQRFGRRIFNLYEQPEFERRVEDVIERHGREQGMRKLAEWLAGRFAAKEAAIKAIRSRHITWHDITIRVPPGHKEKVAPQMVIAAASASAFASMKTGTVTATATAAIRKSMEHEEDRDLEGAEARLSLSHDGEYATAVVLAVDKG